MHGAVLCYCLGSAGALCCGVGTALPLGLSASALYHAGMDGTSAAAAEPAAGQARSGGHGVSTSPYSPAMGNVTYVRWRLGESRRGRVFPPLAADHPAYAVACLLCDRALGDGASVQLLVIEDGSDSKAEYWHSAKAVIAHESCIAALDDAALDDLLDELEPMPTRYVDTGESTGLGR